MNIPKYFAFHTNCLLRKKLYWIYIGLIYFIFAFADLKNLWINDYDDYVDRCADHQMVICFALIFVISLLIYEEYFHIYESYFSIYIEKPVTYFATIVLTGILANIVPFILGQLTFFTLNAVYTGFASWTLLLVNMLVVSLEIISLILFGIGLFMLFKKVILAVFFYLFITFISSMFPSPYTSVPLIAKITKSYGAYYNFPANLWIGRSLLFGICLLFFSIAVYRFIRKCNSD